MTLRGWALAALVACRPPGASPAAATMSATVAFEPCEPAGTAPPPPAPPMTVEARGPVVTLHVPPIVANCCPTPWATVVAVGDELRVAVRTVTPGAESCRCFCYLPVDVTVRGVPAGAWTAVVLDEKGREVARAAVEVSRR